MDNVVKWKNYEEWEEYGIDNRYEKINVTVLKDSKKKCERRWYYIGRRKNWLKDFNFNNIRDKGFSFKNFEDWKEYGMNQGFNKNYPSDLINSKEKTERSWYKKGSKNCWISRFDFKKERKGSVPWKDYESWREYGIGHEYDKKSRSSLQKSKDKSERYWYKTGYKKLWVNDFEFIKSGELLKNLEYVIKETHKVLDENNWEKLPPPKTLIDSGYKKLTYAIMRHHSGFKIFRERLRECMNQPSDKDQLEEMLEKYVGGKNDE